MSAIKMYGYTSVALVLSMLFLSLIRMCFKKHIILENNFWKFIYVIVLFLIHWIDLIIIMPLIYYVHFWITGTYNISNESIMIYFLIGIPCYTLVFILFDFILFRESVINFDKEFFKLLQVISEILLILLTFSLILVTLAGTLKNNELQMNIIIYILMFYGPFIPLIGSLKIANVLYVTRGNGEASTKH